MAAKRVVFSYWGRRGAMSLFALRLAEAAGKRAGIDARFVVSAGNEMRAAFDALGSHVVVAPLFRAPAGALRLDRLLSLRRIMRRELEGAALWIELMPHIWSPFCEDLHAARAVIVHDADRHPGDATGFVNAWLRASALRAATVFTLSQHVADRLAAQGVARGKLRVLFHPDLDIGQAPASAPRAGPLRVLFFGRVLAYKGLPLLIEAVERLRAAGCAIELGVFGHGDLGASAPRLRALGADVVNRWLDVEELAPIFARYDVMALPYVEASQSGAAAVALAAGLPLIATPAGGLREQVRDGENGLLARAATAEAFAESLKRVAEDRALLARLRLGAAAGAAQRSMDAFLTALLEAAC